ncbi:hypothetical protein [Mycolicibacterium fortuitum]
MPRHITGTPPTLLPLPPEHPSVSLQLHPHDDGGLTITNRGGSITLTVSELDAFIIRVAQPFVAHAVARITGIEE